MQGSEPLVTFPQKRTDSVDWIKPIKEYVKQTVNSHEAENLVQSLEHLNRLRKSIKDAADGKEKVTEQLIEKTFYPYAAWLQHATAHFPLIDGRVKINFGWYDVAYHKKVSLPNVNYEYASVMFNAAAVYQFLGFSEERQTAESVKAAFKYFQTAAGLLEQCKERTSSITDRLPPEFSADGLAAFSTLTLAAAHQCSYAKATADLSDKPTVLSKLAMEGSFMYEELKKLMAHPLVAEVADKKWVTFADFYRMLYEARAHQHLADEALKQTEIGLQIGRLNTAQVLLQQCSPLAKSLGGTFPTFLQNFLNQVQKQLHLANNDNEKIYHERIPARDALKAPDRLGKTFAKALPLGDLVEITKVTDPFVHVTPVHILDAHQKFRDEVTSMINNQYTQISRHQEKLRDAINSMGVMGVIGTFESRTQTLPPSLRDRISSIQAAARTSGSCLEYLSERRALLSSLADSVVETNQRLLGLLDAEAKADRELRGKFARRWTREPSEHVNRDLVVKLQEYANKVQLARQGDNKIDEKLKENFDSISRLSLPEEKLKQLLPAPGASPDDKMAQDIVNEMKGLLKQLGDKENAERAKLQEMRELLEHDEKELPMQLAAGGPEKQAAVTEAAKKRYEEKSQYLIQLSIEADNLQNQIISAVDQLNKVRKSDPANIERERVINSLDQACNKYEEISANVSEGINFYARVSEVMDQFKARVEDFVYARNVQKEDLLSTIQREAAHVQQEQDLLALLEELEVEQKKQQEALQQEKAKQDQMRQSQQTWYQQQSHLPPPLFQPPAQPHQSPAPYAAMGAPTTGQQLPYQPTAVPQQQYPAAQMYQQQQQPQPTDYQFHAQQPSQPLAWAGQPSPFASPQQAPPPPYAPQQTGYPPQQGAPQYSYQPYPGPR